MAIVLASVLLFLVVRDQLYSGIDKSLRDDASTIANVPPDDFRQTFYLAPTLRLSGTYAQVVESNGTSYIPPGPAFVPLPVDARTLQATHGNEGPSFRNAPLAGRRVRILTISYPYANIAIQVARPLDDVDSAV